MTDTMIATKTVKAPRKTVSKVNKTAAVKTPSAKAVAKTIKLDKHAARAALIPIGIFAAGLALSLSHQAHGVTASTTVADWEGWATAIEIDCGFLAAKGLPHMARGEAERRAIETWSKPLAIACFILCAYFNSAGYTGFVPNGYFRACIGVALGCFVPGVMLAMSQIARILYLGRAR